MSTLENSTEMEELRRRFERLNVLHQVNTVIHSTLDPQRALQLIVGEAVRVMSATSGSLVLINPTTGFLEIEAAHGLPGGTRQLRLKVGEGITGWVARTGKAARVGDVSNDPRYIMVKENIRSELAAPLEVAGELRGVLNVDSDRLNAFSAEDEQLLRDLAVQAAQVIRNTWLYEQLRQKAALFESLISVSHAINSTINVDEALSVITREACRLIGGKLCSLLMLDDSNEWLELRSSHGAGEAYINKPRLKVEESLLGTVVRRKKPLQVEDVQVSNRYQHIEVARQEGLVSLVSVPLMFNKKCIGTLSVYKGESHIFSNEEIRILSALAELSGIAIEKARLYEKIVDTEERLRQNEKLSAIGLLAAEVAHEIRNPLTVINMLFHSLDLKFPENDARGKDVEVLRERINHLGKIVEQILDFARSAEPDFQLVNVNDVAGDLALLVRHKLTNQRIRFELSLEPNLPRVEADAAQLSQALLNLVLNAAEAMPEGGDLQIKTGFEPGDTGRTQVLIEVTDSGPGLTGEQKANAFKNILQTTKKGGSGLGLAIVGRIVEAHRGEIKILGRNGKGTTFRIILPGEENR